MSHSASASFSPLEYPRGFRARRGLNWGFLGLLYTSFYMCRYNFSIANKAISEEFGFSRAEMGYIITTALFAYACGQIINGLLTDQIGGKRAMLIGAAGTIVMNILFGAASFAGMLGLFIAIRGVDGYLQAFGAPGMVKINTAWFQHRERGRFSGIFGFMINLGRLGIFTLGPALLAGFTILGLIHIPALHWRWLFWTPSVICAVAAVGMALTVKETPEEAGFAGVIQRRQRPRRRRGNRPIRSGHSSHPEQPGGLDHGLCLRLHRRGAASGGPVVPPLHAGPLPGGSQVGSVSVSGLSHSLRGLGGFVAFRLRI